MSYLTQHSETVVERDDNNVAVASQHAAIHHVASAFGIRAPVDEDHHWPLPPLLVDVLGKKKVDGYTQILEIYRSSWEEERRGYKY